ncbi:MAG: tetratricopeptide repeat protein, partial [Flavihumibacter sp.]
MIAPTGIRPAYKGTALFLLVFFCVSNHLAAQSSGYPDSLKHYNKAGLYGKALPFAIKQYEATKSRGKNDSTHIAAIYDVGFDYYLTGNYDSAAVYFAAACEGYKNLYGEKNANYTSSLTDLASAYKNTGKFKIAEELYLKTLSLKKEVAGENDGYAVSLNQLGLLYLSLGRYSNAEDCFARQYAIAKKLGEKTNAFARAAGTLSIVYARIGNYPRAEKLQLQSLEIRRALLGEKHPDYALALSNLGTLYGNTGNYVKADSVQTLALEITKETLGETHPQYLRLLHNLGVNSTNRKNYTAAEAFYKQALEGWKRVYGEDDPDYLFMFDALSNLYA